MAQPAFEQVPFGQVLGHTKRIFDVSFHPHDSGTIASCSDDDTVRVWRGDAADGHYLQAHSCAGHAESCLRASWSPDGETLASGSADGTVRLWRLPEADIGAGVTSGQELAVLDGHPAELYCCDFLEAAPHLLLAASGESLFLWDVAQGALLQEAEPRRPAEDGLPAEGQGPPPYVFGVARQPGGGRLAAVACADGAVRMWDTGGAALRQTSQVAVHQGICSAVAFADEYHVAATSSMGDVAVMDVRNLSEAVTDATCNSPVLSCCWVTSGGRRWLAAVGGAPGILLLDMLAPAEEGMAAAVLMAPPLYAARLLTVVASPDCSLLASAGEACLPPREQQRGGAPEAEQPAPGPSAVPEEASVLDVFASLGLGATPACSAASDAAASGTGASAGKENGGGQQSASGSGDGAVGGEGGQGKRASGLGASSDAVAAVRRRGRRQVVWEELEAVRSDLPRAPVFLWRQ